MKTEAMRDLVRLRPVEKSDLSELMRIHTDPAVPDDDTTVSDIDGDAGLDCWSISNVERKGPAGETIPANAPHLEQSDLTD